MLYIGVQHIDFIISLIGFIAGLALLITPRINTAPSCRAFPILIGMAGWMLLLVLVTTALTQTRFAGIQGIIHKDWLYSVYKAVFLFIWFHYLRSFAKLHGKEKSNARINH